MKKRRRRRRKKKKKKRMRRRRRKKMKKKKKKRGRKEKCREHWRKEVLQEKEDNTQMHLYCSSLHNTQSGTHPEQ